MQSSDRPLPDRVCRVSVAVERRLSGTRMAGCLDRRPWIRSVRVPIIGIRSGSGAMFSISTFYLRELVYHPIYAFPNACMACFDGSVEAVLRKEVVRLFTTTGNVTISGLTARNNHYQEQGWIRT